MRVLKNLVILSWLFAFGVTVTCLAGPTPPELVIYAYDSLVSRHSLGAEIIPLFEKKCACKIRIASAGDGGALMAKIRLENKLGSAKGHLVWGVDQQLWARNQDLFADWGNWLPFGIEKVAAHVRMVPGFLPFDYGTFALMADFDALKKLKLKAPHSVRQLIEPQYAKLWILEDPRLSTPGLGFLLYARELLGTDSARFLEMASQSWLTLTPGWDGAYALFLGGKAPMVWSYVTSQAYHQEHGDRTGRYQAVLFDEGQSVQIEGAAILKNSGETPLALKLSRQFLEFLISEEVQTRVPKGNWMLPVREGTPLPLSFQALPEVKRWIKTPTTAAEVDRSLQEFGSALRRGNK